MTDQVGIQYSKWDFRRIGGIRQKRVILKKQVAISLFVLFHCQMFFSKVVYYTSTKTHALSLIRVPDPSLLMLPQTNGFPADVLLQSDTADPPRVSDDDGHQWHTDLTIQSLNFPPILGVH